MKVFVKFDYRRGEGEIMQGKFNSRFIISILLIYKIKYVFADENTTVSEDKKSPEYFIQDNQLGAQWPHGIVPYYINPNHYDNLVARRVRLAMNHLEDSSCIKFKALSEPTLFTPWIHISNPSKIRDCVHTSENKTGLEIPLVLGYECLQRREILHALMHAIGFKDEVTHPQRDQYVRVMWENIHPQYHPLFQVRYDDFAPVQIEYDPNSIMHFHDRAFSTNGQSTIAALIPGLAINPTSELSPLDKMKLRLIFGHECNKRRVGDLLDSCKMVMRDGNDTTPQKPSPQNMKHDVENQDEDKDTEEDKEIDEPNEDNKDESVNQKDVEEAEVKDVDNANDESVKDDDDDVDEEIKKKRHRRHHKYDRY